MDQFLIDLYQSIKPDEMSGVPSRTGPACRSARFGKSRSGAPAAGRINALEGGFAREKNPLNSQESGHILDGVNILIVPMLNTDGAMGDVNFPLDGAINWTKSVIG